MLKLVLTASAIYLAVFGIGFMFAHRETGLEAVPEMHWFTYLLPSPLSWQGAPACARNLARGRGPYV
jgi:hypothetical protein